MSNETKRDVFEKLLSEYVDDELRIDGLVYEPDQNIGELDREYFTTSYAAALPDDLPVIPKEVSDRLKQAKADRSSLRYMFAASSINMLSDWWMAQDPENEDTFSRAWVLGVWRVEETGEIVKLEAER